MRNERITQNRIVQLLEKELGYVPLYGGNLQDRPGNSNIETAVLETYLTQQRGYAPAIATKAILELKKAATMAANDDLYPINKQVYHILRYGVKARQDVSENHQSVHFIDWQNPENNQFYFAEEVTVKDKK